VIPIRNIYYMLSYAFRVLSEQGYKKFATEEFNNVADLCAAILSQGVSNLIKRGLGREYIEQTEPLSSVRGKIDVSASIKDKTLLKKQLVCTYDDFSVNSYMNRIIKTTMMALIKADISSDRKKSLRKLLVYFGEVDTLDIYTINWQQQYNRNNQTYQMLIYICYLVIKGLLQTDKNGNTRMMDYLDDQKMHRLYEKFILEYFRKEHKELKASSSQIEWVLDDENSNMLPAMQSDIMLEKGNQILIIDAKYYSHTTQTQFDKHTVHSGNLYQIFTYVKNKEAALKDTEHKVSGMLLYAKTDETVQPDETYHMSGNIISVKILDLNLEFSEIAVQLDTIAEKYFTKSA